MSEKIHFGVTEVHFERGRATLVVEVIGWETFSCENGIQINGYDFTEILEEGYSIREREFKLGDLVRKKSGSEWEGKIVGFYSTELNPDGYCVESNKHLGSVQIYPGKALEKVQTVGLWHEAKKPKYWIGTAAGNTWVICSKADRLLAVGRTQEEVEKAVIKLNREDTPLLRQGKEGRIEVCWGNHFGREACEYELLFPVEEGKS